MKYFVVSDVHSFYKELMDALSEKGFEIDNQQHILCVCGDLFDRGDGTTQLFELIKELNEQNRLIYIRGNHEDLLFECMEEIKMGYTPRHHHFSNCTVKTICQFCGQSEWIIFDASWRYKICKTMEPILDFIKNTSINYAEIGDYILVHGWIPSICDNSVIYPTKKHMTFDPNWKQPSSFKESDIIKYETKWDEARWLNGMAAWEQGVRIPNKTIICGHWHCSWGWSHIRQERKEWPQKNRKGWVASFEPFADDGVLAIDACTAYSGKVNCVAIEV